MRRVLAATAALVLFSIVGPDVPRAEAGLCRFYCETIGAGCNVTIGKIDDEYCDGWREGCKAGCEVKME